MYKAEKIEQLSNMSANSGLSRKQKEHMRELSKNRSRAADDASHVSRISNERIRTVNSKKPIVLPLGQRITPKNKVVNLSRKGSADRKRNTSARNAPSKFNYVSNLKAGKLDEKSQDIPPTDRQQKKKQNFISLNKAYAGKKPPTKDKSEKLAVVK